MPIRLPGSLGLECSLGFILNQSMELESQILLYLLNGHPKISTTCNKAMGKPMIVELDERRTNLVLSENTPIRARPSKHRISNWTCYCMMPL